MAKTAVVRAISALRTTAPVSSVLANAWWNHLVVKPDSGKVGVMLLFTEKMTSTMSGANKKATKPQK